MRPVTGVVNLSGQTHETLRTEDAIFAAVEGAVQSLRRGTV